MLTGKLGMQFDPPLEGSTVQSGTSSPSLAPPMLLEASVGLVAIAGSSWVFWGKWRSAAPQLMSRSLAEVEAETAVGRSSAASKPTSDPDSRRLRKHLSKCLGACCRRREASEGSEG